MWGWQAHIHTQKVLYYYCRVVSFTLKSRRVLVNGSSGSNRSTVYPANGANGCAVRKERKGPKRTKKSETEKERKRERERKRKYKKKKKKKELLLTLNRLRSSLIPSY